jgi:hypothetical protein
MGSTCATTGGFSYMTLTNQGFILKKNSIEIFGFQKN